MNIRQSNGVEAGNLTPPRRNTKSQRQQDNRNSPLVQSAQDWRSRTLRAYRNGQLDEYEAKRIFRLHSESFNPLQHISAFIQPVIADLLEQEAAR